MPQHQIDHHSHARACSETLDEGLAPPGRLALLICLQPALCALKGSVLARP